MIHAVGPRLGEGEEDSKLFNATLNSLKLGEEKKISSIAFPAISKGIFGFPTDRCSKVILEAVHDFLRNELIKLMRVDFILFDQAGIVRIY